MPRGNTTSAKQGLAYARQLYLYGNGDGKPVLDSVELAKRSGLHQRTVRDHLPAWTAEREEKLRESPQSPFKLVLSGNTVSYHKHDVEFWRNQSCELKQDVVALEETRDALSTVVETIAAQPNLTEKQLARLLKLLDRHLKTVLARGSALSQLKTALQMWQHGAGVTAALDALSTAQKEEARGKAKLEAKEALKALENEGERAVRGVSSTTDPVFKRVSGNEKGGERPPPC